MKIKLKRNWKINYKIHNWEINSIIGCDMNLLKENDTLWKKIVFTAAMLIAFDNSIKIRFQKLLKKIIKNKTLPWIGFVC